MILPWLKERYPGVKLVAFAAELGQGEELKGIEQKAYKSGADEVIVYSQQDFEEETKRFTDGKGVNVVYDGVGKTTFDKDLNIIRPRGYLVLFGDGCKRNAVAGQQRLVGGDDRFSGAQRSSDGSLGRIGFPANQFDEDVDLRRLVVAA